MNVDDAPREEKYLTGFDCKAGINDGKILSDVSQSVSIFLFQQNLVSTQKIEFFGGWRGKI